MRPRQAGLIDLFVHTLRDIYYPERQIVQALPDMIEKAHDAQLKNASARDGKSRQTALEKVFQMHGTEPQGVDCPAIDGIIEEADDVAGELIAAAQAVGHAAQAVGHYE